MAFTPLKIVPVMYLYASKISQNSWLFSLFHYLLQTSEGSCNEGRTGKAKCLFGISWES